MKRFFVSAVFVLTIILFGGSTAYAAEIDTESLQYIIAEGTTYYESSWNFGSGRQNVVNGENPYTTEPCFAAINGYSYLDQNGNVIVSEYDESTNDISIPSAPEGAVKLFKHFRSKSFRNGWVDSSNVTLKDIEKEEKKAVTPIPQEETEKPEKQDSEELAEMIQEYDGMTVVIVDRSSSMDDFAEQATERFRKLNIDEETTKVYVFGRYFKEIQAKDITASNSDVRKNEESYDYIADVINDAKKYDPKHIIILTDLGVFDGEILEQNNLETIDILVPYYENSYAKERYENIKKSFPNAKVVLRLFDEK